MSNEKILLGYFVPEDDRPKPQREMTPVRIDLVNHGGDYLCAEDATGKKVIITQLRRLDLVIPESLKPGDDPGWWSRVPENRHRVLFMLLEMLDKVLIAYQQIKTCSDILPKVLDIYSGNMELMRVELVGIVWNYLKKYMSPDNKLTQDETMELARALHHTIDVMQDGIEDIDKTVKRSTDLRTVFVRRVLQARKMLPAEYTDPESVRPRQSDPDPDIEEDENIPF